MNPVLKANETAWRGYMGTQTFQCHREDFDAGWEAALAYVAPLLWEWANGGAAGEAVDLAEQSDELLERIGYRGGQR